MEDDVWREVDSGAAWKSFNQRFSFEPDYYERDRPAIKLPPTALVIDLGPIFGRSDARWAAGVAAVNAAAFRAFVWIAEDEELVALDWQHPAYRYSAARQVVAETVPPIPVFPDGDYYAPMTSDLRWGTFGHPWQQTLTIWGDELIACLGTELLTWLPRHRQSVA